MEADGFLPVPLAELVFLAYDGAGALAHLEESVGMQRNRNKARSRKTRHPIPMIDISENERAHWCTIPMSVIPDGLPMHLRCRWVTALLA